MKINRTLIVSKKEKTRKVQFSDLHNGSIFELKRSGYTEWGAGVFMLLDKGNRKIVNLVYYDTFILSKSEELNYEYRIYPDAELTLGTPIYTVNT